MDGGETGLDNELGAESEGKTKDRKRRKAKGDGIEQAETGGPGGMVFKNHTHKDDFDYDHFEELGKLGDPQAFDDYGPIMMLGDQVDPDAIIEPDEHAEEEEQKGQLNHLSYNKTRDHIYRSHPMDREEKTKFNWLQCDLSYIPLLSSWIKKTDWVTPVAKEIGLGPTLFLMTQKAFFWVFVLFTIINIPLILFYTGGSGTSETGGNFVTMFGKFSLGNLGTSQHTCASLNVA